MTTEDQQTQDFVKQLEAQTQEVGDRLDSLWEKMSEGNYMEQGYAPDSEVVISGELFQSFINHVASSKKVVDSIKQAFDLITKSIDATILDQSKMTIHLMEQHIKNVDDGRTISNSVLDKEDAKVKIKEVKNEK